MYKILVVDDEFRIRQIIRKYAEFEGYEVDEAVDGMQAIQVCRKENFDLIIMDVMMPELDGFSACREIKKFKPEKYVSNSENFRKKIKEYIDKL